MTHYNYGQNVRGGGGYGHGEYIHKALQKHESTCSDVVPVLVVRS